MALFIILNIVVAIIAVLVIGGIARWIAGYFTTAEGARIASMAAAIGYAVAKYTFVKPVGVNVLAPALAAGGAIIGLVALWFLLFRYHRQQTA